MCGLSAVASPRVASAWRSASPRSPRCRRRTSRRAAARRAASSLIESSRLRAISGTRTLSSNWPCMPPIGDRGVVADHLRRDLDHDLGDDRVDLAGHDRGALLQLRQEDLGEAGARAGAHQREVVGDLHRARPRTTLSAPESSTRASRLPCASNGRPAPRSCRPVVGGELLADLGGELGVGVEAGAGRGAAERDLADPAQASRSTRSMPEPHLRRVAAELLAERDRAPRPSGGCGRP